MEKSKQGEYLRGLALIADHGAQRGEKLSLFSMEEKTQLIEKYTEAEAHLTMVWRLLCKQEELGSKELGWPTTRAEISALSDICYGALEKLQDVEKLIKDLKPLQP
jgi:hypothetical protein